ncbi:hypothetical protein GCM10023083_60990 [Streptomyces phyllanthi]
MHCATDSALKRGGGMVGPQAPKGARGCVDMRAPPRGRDKPPTTRSPKPNSNPADAQTPSPERSAYAGAMSNGRARSRNSTTRGSSP